MKKIKLIVLSLFLIGCSDQKSEETADRLKKDKSNTTVKLLTEHTSSYDEDYTLKADIGEFSDHSRATNPVKSETSDVEVGASMPGYEKHSTVIVSLLTDGTKIKKVEIRKCKDEDGYIFTSGREKEAGHQYRFRVSKDRSFVYNFLRKGVLWEDSDYYIIYTDYKDQIYLAKFTTKKEKPYGHYFLKIQGKKVKDPNEFIPNKCKGEPHFNM